MATFLMSSGEKLRNACGLFDFISLTHTSLCVVFRRAIPMSHLRSHPNFKSLPPPSFISHLPTKEHARYFRQDSWQWDYLHQGRCTTSQAAAALGFLEPRAAGFLGIPKTLQRGAGGAWQRLSQDTSSIDRLEDMERILCEGHTSHCVDVDNWRPGISEVANTWVEASKLRNRFPFIAKYTQTITEDELVTKKMQMQHRMKHTTSSLSTRMNWGNAQEATSILTALNYFCGIDKRTTIQEVGMCGAGFDDSYDSDLNGLKIGASPDAIIRHGDGMVEVLEVKNHCPFAWNNHGSTHNRRRGKNKHKGKHKHATNNIQDAKFFTIRDFELESKVPAVYIPQLMMEMFCVGDGVDLEQSGTSTSRTPICKSAIMIRQTATRGAIVLRLHRDDLWLSEMKYFLGQFKRRYVDAVVIPPDDFFFSDEDSRRYKTFLQMTKDLSEGVEQVACIDHGQIQRVTMNKSARFETPPLFLDDVECI
jgi:hypothetical protein